LAIKKREKVHNPFTRIGISIFVEIPSPFSYFKLRGKTAVD